MWVAGLMVVRDEAHRYLESAVTHLGGVVDGVFVVDDGSSDNSREVAAAAGATVLQRPDGVPAFMDHEAQFRAWAWAAVTAGADPTVIVSVDADEQLATTTGDTNPATVRAALRTDLTANLAVTFHVTELWAPDWHRTDGYWGSITEARTGPPRGPDGSYEFGDRPLGSGSVPTHARISAEPATETMLLHYGYARETDRRAKHARYRSRPGHSTRHVDSILGNPTLEHISIAGPKLQRATNQPV